VILRGDFQNISVFTVVKRVNLKEKRVTIIAILSTGLAPGVKAQAFRLLR